MTHLVYNSILKRRNLSMPLNPIWKMNISPEEQVALAETLQEAYNQGVLDDYDKEAVLYYAAWWQRSYSGGAPSREMIAKSAGISSEGSDALYKAARKAMRIWGIKPIHDTHYHFFRSLLLQGGLPINHVVNNKGNFNNYSVFLRSLVKDMSNLNTEFTTDIIPRLSCVSYLPKSFCNNSIYEISIQIARAIIEDREDLLPYDSSKQGELRELTSSLQRTAQQAKKERSRKPLSFTWELQITDGKLNLSYFLNNIANIGSEMIQGLNPRECFSFDVFISTQYIATYKRIALENDEFGHAHGIYHRMNFEQRHFPWKGESYIESKLIPNDGESIFVSALNCYPPDFSLPQQFQQVNDYYVQQRGRLSEANIVITTDNWESNTSKPDKVSSLKDTFLCYFFSDILVLRNKTTDERVEFSNTYTKYSAEFGGVFIPWLESSNFKLIARMPDFEVFDDNNQRVDRRLYTISYRKPIDYEWHKITRGVILPFGMIEFRLICPDQHILIEKFYNVGDMTFIDSNESVDSANIDFVSSHGKALIENADGIQALATGINKWKIIRDKDTSVATTVSFTILHKGDPALHIELPAPFKGILLVDNQNNEVKSEDVISVDNLYNYRIISHGIVNPQIRISYINSMGEEQRVAITGTVNDGITPLSNLEEPIQRMYDLYVNDYKEESNYVFLFLNGIGVKIRRFAYISRASANGNAIEIEKVANPDAEIPVIYNGNIMAVASSSECSIEDTEILQLIKAGPHTFYFPDSEKHFEYIIFSDRFDKRKIIPQQVNIHEDANLFNQIKEYCHSSKWGEKLDESSIDKNRYWQLAVRYFEVASEYKLPFKSFSCLDEIMKEPIRLAKLILALFMNGRQELFLSEVNRLEQEFAIGIHWIKAEEWQETFDSFYNAYFQNPTINAMLLPKLMEFLRDILNSTLDSDFTDTFISYIMGQNLGQAPMLSIPEMQMLRSRSVGKNYGNNDLPCIEIALQGKYYAEQAKRGMTFYQLTMVKAPLRIVEYLRGIGPDIWHDDSAENLTMRRVINFYRNYFTTVYSQILQRMLKYTISNGK